MKPCRMFLFVRTSFSSVSILAWCVVETSGVLGGANDEISENDEPLDYINKWGYCYGKAGPLWISPYKP